MLKAIVIMPKKGWKTKGRNVKEGKRRICQIQKRDDGNRRSVWKYKKNWKCNLKKDIWIWKEKK